MSGITTWMLEKVIGPEGEELGGADSSGQLNRQG